MNFTFNIRPIVRNWDDEMIANIADLIDTGIAYWCSIDSDEPTPQPPLLYVVVECETLQGNDKPHTKRIDLGTITLGINRILSYECEINTRSIGNIAAFVATNDLSYIDCEDMDCIVQAGLYNDIMWG